MKPEQLRYDQEIATRYSHPPPILALEGLTLSLIDSYDALLKLRLLAETQHTELVAAGIFESIPTLTSETKNGRPGTYWRAVFRTNSPEVLHGKARKHYIGNDEAKLQQWTAFINRTHHAMKLNRLIFNIGSKLKNHFRTTDHTAGYIAANLVSYQARLQELTP